MRICFPLRSNNGKLIAGILSVSEYGLILVCRAGDLDRFLGYTSPCQGTPTLKYISIIEGSVIVGRLVPIIQAHCYQDRPTLRAVQVDLWHHKPLGILE